MNNITLSSELIIKGKYKGSTKFEFFKDLKEGDLVEISMNLKKQGRGRSGLYAPEIKLKCNNKTFNCSLNQTMNYLGNIEYESR